jgi:hypothetical protein
VYAIGSPIRGSLDVTGIARERLTIVRTGAIAAYVGRMRRIPPPAEAQLRRYDRVQQRLAVRVAALLPARYGTDVRDLEELTVILQSRQAALRRQLARVRGRVQMTVRILNISTHPRAFAPSHSRTFAPSHPRTGTAYLLTRARAHAVPEFDSLRAAVRRWVKDERVEKRGSVATVYHLVPRGSAETYRRALTRRAAAEGIRVVTSGPWPPYAFADPLD